MNLPAEGWKAESQFATDDNRLADMVQSLESNEITAPFRVERQFVSLRAPKSFLNRLQEASLECLPRETGHSEWSRIKFVMRGVAHGLVMRPWLDFLSNEQMRPIARQYPRLFLKVQWPYLNRTYSGALRFKMLQNHYRFLLERVTPDVREQLLTKKFFTLARWSMPELGGFSVRLSHENKFSQEGEMVLGLYQDEPERLCTLLCFSITGKSEISIGCMQGNRPVLEAEPSNKDFNVVLTRRMHGMRPKNLLLFVLRQLAQTWSISRLRAVGNAQHIFKTSLRSDYDQFWIEAEGVLAADGMYDIEVAQPVRDLLEIPSKKRTMYRRRYEFQAALTRLIEEKLAAPRREATVFEA